ncbi:MAG: DUF2164 domain-containing protein [Rhodothermales bacterium]|nr:DUF2164 domain-containing protein [Rhodothermales bacterium]
MAITLAEADRNDAVASIQRYAEENLDQPMGGLAAGALLDYILEEIGPSIYNQAVADVQERLHARLAEIDSDLHEEPFGYWRKRAGRRKR